MKSSSQLSFPKPKTVKLSQYEKAQRKWESNKGIKSMGKVKVDKKLSDKVFSKYSKIIVERPKVKRKAKKRILLTPIPKLKKKADVVFSKWIRERDKHLCFAKDIPGEGTKCKGSIQCCHLIKRTFSPTRYDELNCHAGCSHHNFNHDHGFNARPEVMTNWFVKNWGALVYADLYDKSRQSWKWTRTYLQEIIKKYG